MKRIMYEILGGVPFLLATETGGIKLNYARLVEALIIAGVGGFFAAQLTMGELKTKLTYLEGQNSRMEQQISATCTLVQEQMQEITRIDTLQKERIERERRIGSR